MTVAAAAPTSSQPNAPQSVPIVILGTDAVLAALPATPVQLAHACLRAGFANVIPASWGDELIAHAVLRRLPQFGSGPAIQCSCPIVAHRLLTVGGDLRPVLLPFVPPPVAAARYIRVLARPARPRITYVGACPGAMDDSIDIRMTPESLIALLAERDIVIEDQPRVFESVIPPDRRRFRSQPGGVPTTEALWSELGGRTLVEVGSEDFVSEIAQHLLTGKNVLVDVSTRLGCACSGAVAGARSARAQLTSVEPPRATAAVVDEAPPINLELPVPATSRTPVDVVAISPTPPSSHLATHTVDPNPGNRSNAPRSSGSTQEQRPPRLSTPVVPRPVLSGFPVARDGEGKALPRAYVARRRSSPKGIPVMPEDAPPTLPPETTPPPEAKAPLVPLATAPLVEPSPAPEAHIDPEPVVEAPVVDASVLAPVVPAVTPPVTLSADQPTMASESAPIVSDVVSPVAAPVKPAESTYAPPVASPPVSFLTDRQPVPEYVFKPLPAAPQPTSRSGDTHARAAEPVVRPAPRERYSPPPSQPTFSRGQIVLILLAVTMIAICASTVVAVIVGRSVNPTTTTSQPTR